MDQVMLQREDEEMEEGEILVQGESEAEDDDLRFRLSERRRISGPRGRLEVTVQNRSGKRMASSHLPDLLREIGSPGIESLDRTVTEKMEARAKRFNMQSTGTNVTYDDVMKLYDSLGIPEKEREGQVEPEKRQFRLEAIHIQGLTASGITSDDIYNFFGDIPPISFEWIDSTTCNVIWALATSAAKALLCLSRPVRSRVAAISLGADHDSDKECGANVNVMLHQVNPVQDQVQEEDMDDTGENKHRKLDLLSKFEGPFDTVVPESLLSSPVPEGNWRYGKPYTSLGNTLFMRIAKVDDSNVSKESTDFSVWISKNKKLKQEGGILSSSKRRRIQEVLLHDKQAQDDWERQKRYTGPVGKNPWGAIAMDWTRSNKANHLDYAAELELFRDLRGHRQGPPTSDIRRPAQDWDAPENFDRMSAVKRKASPLCQPVLSDDDAGWNKRLKRPRMSMVADQEESKVSVQKRLLKGSGRRLLNHEQYEIYEEDYSSSDQEEENRKPALHLSDRFKGRIGQVRSVVSTVREVDIDAYSDLKHRQPHKVVVQVNRSPVSGAALASGEDQAMMSADEALDRQRERTRSQVIKVKKEKDDGPADSRGPLHTQPPRSQEPDTRQRGRRERQEEMSSQRASRSRPGANQSSVDDRRLRSQVADKSIGRSFPKDQKTSDWRKKVKNIKKEKKTGSSSSDDGDEQGSSSSLSSSSSDSDSDSDDGSSSSDTNSLSGSSSDGSSSESSDSSSSYDSSSSDTKARPNRPAHRSKKPALHKNRSSVGKRSSAKGSRPASHSRKQPPASSDKLKDRLKDYLSRAKQRHRMD